MANYGLGGMYGVGNYTGDDAAQKTYTDLFRAIYSDYQQRFEPYQEELLNAATSTEMLDQQLSRISATTERTRQQAIQTAEMNRGRLGLQQTAQQKQASQSRMNTSSALADINAKNMARQSAYDNYQNVMQGGGFRPDIQNPSVGGGGTS